MTAAYEDPFNQAPPADQPVSSEGPPTSEGNPPALAPRPVTASGEGKLVVTLKGGRDFDAPWIVIHAADAADATSQLNSELMELMGRVQNAAKHFAGSAPTSPNTAAPAAQQQSRAPQGATQAPNGETRTCAHGPMVFKSGISKAGNAYKLFSCTAPRESQCKAQYLRD